VLRSVTALQYCYNQILRALNWQANCKSLVFWLAGLCRFIVPEPVYNRYRLMQKAIHRLSLLPRVQHRIRPRRDGSAEQEEGTE
jgi:hypothetical protein